uniref:Exostosin GT47 domain-containing protein n=1 Tax=Panagrolaimus sp. PS1159 TaxID=55785 RepID=A0AC35G5U8_9BILA
MYLNQGKIARWFGQNVVATHPDLENIPIGVIGPYQDYMPLYDAIIHIKPYFDRMTLLYLNFSPRTNGNRSSILQYFKKEFKNNSRVIIDEVKSNWTEYLFKMRNSQFVLSPPGNGMDCFRTWEALAVGAVPIVFNNSLLPLYEDMTVMVVNDWNEVTEENMLKFQRERLKNFSKDGIPWRPKVWLRYWINRIINYKTNFQKHHC